MYESDKRIIHLISYLIYQKQITSDKEFCNIIDMIPTTIPKIKKGSTHFTVLQIEKICEKFNVNANWVFGLEKKVFRSPKSIEITEII